VQSVIGSVASQGQTIRKPTMLFSVSRPYCRFADEVAPDRIGTWLQLLACTEIEYAEMAKYVSDDVMLMRPQCRIRRLEIAMNWAPRGSFLSGHFYFFEIAVADKNFPGAQLGRCIRRPSPVSLGTLVFRRPAKTAIDNASDTLSERDLPDVAGESKAGRTLTLGACSGMWPRSLHANSTMPCQGIYNAEN
jgi:hypothetical protein